MHIYYYHPLKLDFASAQTIQVIRDYREMVKLGYQVSIYGVYHEQARVKEVEAEAQGIEILSGKSSSYNRTLLKIRFLYCCLVDNGEQLIVTRTLKKALMPRLIRFFKKRVKWVHEMHEESFPYLLKAKESKENFYKAIQKIDHIIFTSPAQLMLYQKEFNEKPKSSIVLPNGVDYERFNQAKRGDGYALTYLGQFNDWKNVDLVFASFALLDERFTLRIAGGKGDQKSHSYIEEKIKKYSIDKERIDYLGYVPNKDVVKKVLDGSRVLLLPLGENIQSKFLTSPMKLFEYMATRIPVVAVGFETVESITGEDTAFLSECDQASFKEAILKALECDGKRLDMMNKKVQEYTYHARALKFDKLFNN